MIYSKTIQAAINFATDVHEIQQKHRRKGKDIPYLVHVLSVGIILARVTEDDNIIAAGIIHDTIEDCQPSGSVTKRTIEQKFNADVARMVDDVSERAKDLPWLERKMTALQHIQHMQHDSQLVKSADVLQSLTELVEDIKMDGEGVWQKFNARKVDIITRYRLLIAELKQVWPENPLVEDLEKTHHNFMEMVT